MNQISVTVQEVLQQTFGEHYQIEEKDNVVFGVGDIGSEHFHILGVKESTDFGVAQAFLMAEKVLALIESKSTAPLLLLVDVTGQALSMHDEWIGMHQYFSHLLLCLECLRKAGNLLISLVYNQAIGGAFIAYGLTADVVLALPHATIAVMWLDAMSKVTKLDLALLEKLSQTSPVFAPGAKNFYELGGITKIVELTHVNAELLKLLKQKPTPDERAKLAFERQGRLMTYPVIQAIEQREL